MLQPEPAQNWAQVSTCSHTRSLVEVGGSSSYSLARHSPTAVQTRSEVGVGALASKVRLPAPSQGGLTAAHCRADVEVGGATSYSPAVQLANAEAGRQMRSEVAVGAAAWNSSAAHGGETGRQTRSEVRVGAAAS